MEPNREPTLCDKTRYSNFSYRQRHRPLPMDPEASEPLAENGKGQLTTAWQVGLYQLASYFNVNFSVGQYVILTITHTVQ